jgi:hypothetical protein
VKINSLRAILYTGCERLPTRNFYILCCTWVKFDIGFLIMMLHCCDFSENRCTKSHNLRKGVSEILPYFLHFPSVLDKIWYRFFFTRSMFHDFSYV